MATNIHVFKEEWFTIWKQKWCMFLLKITLWIVFFVDNFNFTMVCLTKIDELITNSLKKFF